MSRRTAGTLRPTVRAMVGSGHWLLWLIAAGILLVVLVSIGRVIGARSSLWEFVANPGRWVLFVTAIAIAATTLSVCVAHGVSRRTFTVALIINGVALAVGGSAVIAAGLLLERWSRTVSGGPPPEYFNPHIFTSASEVPLVLLQYLLVFLGFQTAGYLCGIGYYRLGPRNGTALLVPALLPAVVVELSLGTGLGVQPLAAIRVPLESLPLQIGLAAGAIIAGLAVLGLLLRDIAINPRND